VGLISSNNFDDMNEKKYNINKEKKGKGKK